MVDKVQASAAPNLAVYIVFGIPRRKVNDRTKKLLRLRQQFNKMLLVTPGEQNSLDDSDLVVKRLPSPTGLLRRLGLNALGKVLDRYLFFPSPHILFVLPARRKLLKLIANDLAEGKQVCLLTCAPPHGIGLLGLYIKQRFPEVHWIIDWQDLWSYDENYYEITPSLYRNKLKQRERQMLDMADMNLTTNAYAQAVLTDHYGVAPKRTGFIHHHFDPDDAAGTQTTVPLPARTDSANLIRFGFLGTLFKPPRVPGSDLIAAFTKLKKAGHNIELHLHGNKPQNYKQLADRLQAAGVVLHGPASHEEAVRQLARYDFLLLLLADLPNCKVVMSIKLPHYLMMEKPILAIVPERSAIADIITETGAGVVIPSTSDWSGELEKQLQKLQQEGVVGQRNEAAIRQFAWQHVSQQWLQLLTAPVTHQHTR